MNSSFSKYKIQNFINYFFILFAIAGCYLPNQALASSIEQYDFGSSSFQVTKHWEPEVALYVAKKYAADNGFNEQNVTVTKLKAGATNNFIYLVFVDNQLKFVLKGLSSKKEADALYALQNNIRIKEAQDNAGAAKVCMSKLLNYYITTNDKQNYYFAILEAAEGKELFKIMTYELLQNKDLNKLKDVFYTIGKQISELHKGIIGHDKFITPKNLVTIIHDDFHPENTFYNSDTTIFSLIDNESMGESISKPLPIIREIYGLYEVPIIRWPSEKITIDLLRDANPHDIASIYIELINGMASVYQNSNDAKTLFINQIIELNDKSIAFLHDNTSEPWMTYPTDKNEDHIVWGKFSHAIYDSKLSEMYISKLSIINDDLKVSLNE